MSNRMEQEPFDHFDIQYSLFFCSMFPSFQHIPQNQMRANTRQIFQMRLIVD
jgi:hypothetical protein